MPERPAPNPAGRFSYSRPDIPMLSVRVIGAIALIALTGVASAYPLPSWDDTDARTRIIWFVEDISDSASDNFVPATDRIAVFDYDGTLWGERPVYFQLIFTIDRLREMAAVDATWPKTGRARTPGNAKRAVRGVSVS